MDKSYESKVVHLGLKYKYAKVLHGKNEEKKNTTQFSDDRLKKAKGKLYDR